ncbi:MAG TPA: hypothetical protein DEQ84_02975 [Prevotellaceae bacterium]|nr:hypothetical protein [Prevotellaceae bacterium]
MKLLSQLYVLALSAGMFLSCDSVVLESEAIPDVKDSTEIVSPGQNAEVLSVAEAMALSEGDLVCVKGFVVGSIRGTKIGGACFLAPFDGLVSNLLIADDPAERMPHNCMPIELKSDSEARKQLNLSSHPEMHGRSIIFEGVAKTYFGQMGVKQISAFHFPDSLEILADTVIDIVFPIG